MAKIEDYLQQTLDDEIEEASDESAARQNDEDSIPERFRGKTVAEVVASYQELESLNGRLGNELGQLRRSVDNLAEATARNPQTAKPTEAAKPTPVTVDDLYENADAAVRRVAREESQSRIEELERRLSVAESRAQIAETRSQFEKKHPDYKDTLADQKFLDWIKGSPIRVQLAQAADAGNFDAADELFSTYAALQAVQKPETPTAEQRRRQVQDVSLETSGGGSAPSVEKFSRSKLQEMRIRARHGDPQAERWLSANGDAIREAYAEDRLVT